MHYEGLYINGDPACIWCGEDLSAPRPEEEWCPSCGAGIAPEHPSRLRAEVRRLESALRELGHGEAPDREVWRLQGKLDATRGILNGEM